jgi:hypothetical protein
MKILKDLDLNNVVFIDIETVAVVPKLLPNTPLYESWAYKVKYNKEKIEAGEKTYEQMYEEQAQLYPEFAKIVCITIGKIVNGILKLKSYSDHDETVLLKAFNKDMNNMLAANKGIRLCGHFIVGFDIPFILTRCMICQVEPCSLVDIAAQKPWEVTAIDTQTLWKATSIRSASLINIAVALGLDSPKDEMYGYETTKVYYENPEGLARITKYCEKDVLTTANIVRKCRFEEIVSAETSEIKVEKVGTMQTIYNSKKITAAQEKEIIKTLEGMTGEDLNAANTILKVVVPKKVK